MAELLRINEPGRRIGAPQWEAFMELGFRPLYLAGCLWAALAVGLWVYASQWLIGRLPGVIWHAHEMLWGFVATIAVGFLLTAAANWTGVTPVKGRPLAGLCLLWLLARIGFLVPGAMAFHIAAACELLFFAGAAIALGRSIYPTGSKRNYGVPLLVSGLGLADALYLLMAWRGDYGELMRYFNTGLLCMAVIALLIARRIIPFFAMRAVAGLNIPMRAGSARWQLGAGALAILFSMLDMPYVMAACLSVAGLMSLWQVYSWQPWAVLRKPLLWILYLGYAGLGLGLLIAAAQSLGWPARAAWPVHVIALGGFALLIIGMATRTALGHLGRPLQLDRSMLISYALLIAAVLLRLLALLPGTFTLAALHTSAMFWIAAFLLYVWRFFPMLIRPRLDGVSTKVMLRPQASK